MPGARSPDRRLAICLLRAGNSGRKCGRAKRRGGGDRVSRHPERRADRRARAAARHNSGAWGWHRGAAAPYPHRCRGARPPRRGARGRALYPIRTGFGDWGLAQFVSAGSRWAAARLLAGAFTSDGRYEPTRGGILLTCTGGAEGKCIRFVYKPWGFGPNNISLAPYYQACVRLVRADYCGDGTGHTRDGTPIDLFDTIGIQRDEPAPGMTFEAAWRADGAVCVRHTRLPDVLDSAALAERCPRLAHSIGETCDEAAPALLCNRSFSH